MSIPVFATERLILRPLRMSDFNDFFAYAQDEQVARPGMWEPYDSLEACRLHFESLISAYDKDLKWWAIQHRDDGRMIGRVQLSDWSPQHQRVELSYALHREYWGQGLMTEAVGKAVDYAWNNLKAHRISAVVLTDNHASIRILKKFGLAWEGRLRHHRRLWGQWLDVDIYAALAPSRAQS